MYKNMTKIFENEKIGNAEIRKFVIPENDTYALIQGINPGEYVSLFINNELMMSNTQMEKITNAEFVSNAHGNILIGGLGIGLILLAIQDKKDVEKITVIENNENVIKIVQKQLSLNEKVNIIKADIFDYEPTEKFNTIYIDIWAYINSNIYEEEMKPLMKKYRKHLLPKKNDKNRWINCWCKYEAAHNIRI